MSEDQVGEKPKKAGSLTLEEKDFIAQNCHILTDAQIASHIGRHINTVAKIRRKLRVQKPGGSIVVPPAVNAEVETKLSSIKRQLYTSPRGKQIKKMLSLVDWEFFLDEWAAFQLQFEDLTHTEEANVEHIIFLRLAIYRNRASLNKAIEDSLSLGDIDITTLDLDDDDDQQKYHKINAIESNINDLNKEYRELLDKSTALYKSLSGTREQREKRGAVSKDTFFNLCESFRKKSVRQKEGRVAELLKKATNNKYEVMQETIELADGTMTPQLLNVDTVENMDKQNNKEEKE